MNSHYKYEYYRPGITDGVTEPVTHKHYPRSLIATLGALAVMVAHILAGQGTADAAVDIPSDLPVSPLFGAPSFDQEMPRFEEFGESDVGTVLRRPRTFRCPPVRFPTFVSAGQQLLTWMPSWMRRSGLIRPPRPTPPWVIPGQP